MAWTQPELFSLPPDPDRDAPKRPPPRIAPGDIPRQRWYDHLADAARRLAELHGWSQDVRWATLRALEALVALDQPGQPYHHSRPAVLRGYHNANGARAREVLEWLGLLVDDRPDPRQQWLDQRLAGLAAQIRAELAARARALCDGDERARPKSERTWKPYVTAVVPAARAWSARYRRCARSPATTCSRCWPPRPPTGTPTPC